MASLPFTAGEWMTGTVNGTCRRCERLVCVEMSVVLHYRSFLCGFLLFNVADVVAKVTHYWNTSLR